jgi:uncharacterized membrane protein YeaQ/YmgE (transglycosylase-associated protein family)
MTFFAWLVLGLAAGLLGNRVIGARDGGMAIDATLGVIGAVVCGYVGVLVGIGGVSGLNFPSLLSVIVAAIGALAVVAIYRSVATRA